MDERSGTIHLVESRDPGARSLVTTISRSEVEHALHGDDEVDLVLDVERLAADGDGRENERIALAWTPEDLERLLAMSSADEITLTFDEEEVRRFLDEDVDAHGVRVKLAALTAVAGMAAAAGAGAASAMPVGPDAAGSATNAPAVVAPASEISTGLGDQSAAAGALAVSDHGVLTSAKDAGLTSAPAEASLASASEISTGLGDQSAAADALAVSDHGVLTSAEDAGLTSGPAEASLASASEISTGLGDQSASAEALAVSDHGVLTSAKDAGLTPAPAEASLASASEISTGLGDQSASAEGALAASDHGVLTSAKDAGLTSTPAEANLASASEISTGIVGQAPVAPAEVTAGIVQQPTSQPVSASPSDSTWSPSSAEIGAFAGVILAITAAGFAVRRQRHGGGPAPA